MSAPEDPPQKDPPNEPMAEAPSGTSEVSSVAELYGAPNPPPAQEESIIVSDEPSTSDVVSGETSSGPAASPFVPPSAPPPFGGSDEPILPATTDENALRDAVGIAPTKRRAKAKADRTVDDGEPDVAKGRKLLTIVAVSVLALITIAVFIILGNVNSRRYAITCSTDHIGAEQGRSFPPWGTQQMTGPEWKAIDLPPSAECKPRETENKAELEGWFLEVLLDRASTTLTQPNLLDAVATPGGGAKPGPNVLDHLTEQLQQALLLSRSPDRRDQRKEVERLLGDVQYWRASLRLRDASSALLDASKQFEAAAQQRPRHVTDAAAWGQYVKKLAEDLRAGPNGAPAAQNFPPTPTGERPSAPMGAALPVETLPPQEGSDAPPPPAHDAGVPTGGVLL